MLSSQKAAARYRSLLDEVTPLLLPEALRWGDGNMGAKHSRLLEMNGRGLWGRRVGCLPSFSLSVPLSLKKSFVSRGSIAGHLWQRVCRVVVWLSYCLPSKGFPQDGCNMLYTGVGDVTIAHSLARANHHTLRLFLVRNPQHTKLASGFQTRWQRLPRRRDEPGKAPDACL